MEKINTMLNAMLDYLRGFCGWLDGPHAASVAGDMQVKWSAYWTSHGLPDGWHDDGNESRTRNFVLRHYEHLRQIYHSGDEAAFEAAALRCIREELGVYIGVDLAAEEDIAKHDEGGKEDEEDPDEHEGGPGIPTAGAEHLRRRFERVE